jgi:hypothetical protein
MAMDNSDVPGRGTKLDPQNMCPKNSQEFLTAKAHRTFGSQAHKRSLMLRFFHLMPEKTTGRLVSLPFFILFFPYAPQTRGLMATSRFLFLEISNQSSSYGSSLGRGSRVLFFSKYILKSHKTYKMKHCNLDAIIVVGTGLISSWLIIGRNSKFGLIASGASSSRTA